MRKVTATVMYDSDKNRIYNLTVKHKAENIRLVSYELYEGPLPYSYDDFQEMYGAVLKILKNNNFYVSSWTAFNAMWYDIDFIDINNPVEIKRFAHWDE